MLEAVFISDLHLHPEEPLIQQRFEQFLKWAASSCRKLYILGDFFHVWAGDDNMDAWSEKIAQDLKALSEQGVQIFFMHGNRDFLLGQTFAQKAGMEVIQEPYSLQLDEQGILLTHGDQFCLADKSHQRFRKVTRNPVFRYLFLQLPLRIRKKLVNKVRTISQTGKKKDNVNMDVVPDALLKSLIKYKKTVAIHGHTHKPGFNLLHQNGLVYRHIVLSDWDDSPLLLCYDKSKGFYFNHFNDSMVTYER